MLVSEGVPAGSCGVLASWRGDSVSVQWGWPTGVLWSLSGGELLGGIAGRWPGPDCEIPERGSGEGAEGVMASPPAMRRPSQGRRAAQAEGARGG